MDNPRGTYDMRSMPPPPRTFRIRVLGCRVNHAERRELSDVLKQRGLVPVGRGNGADLEVVHTCTVTTRAAAKSRQAIRRAARGQGDQPTVLVTGCLVGADPAHATTLAGSTGAAFGHDVPLTDSVGRWVDQWLGKPVPSADARPDPTQLTALPLSVLPTTRGDHTRAEVRVQDGCNAWCTFCIIPKTRPVLRTKSVETVVQEVIKLIDLGHQEVVLSGIFLGAYGHETALRRKQANLQSDPLADLVDAVASIDGLARLRLSSLEPGDVTDPLLDAMIAHDAVVAGHLHLPLQSGADTVLKRMNRQYRVGAYLDMVDRVNQALTTPDGLPPAITTDIICGFPGESRADFDQTIHIAQRVGFLHMHVFPFSPHDGTAAARWTTQAIPMQERRARVRELIALESGCDGLSVAYRKRLIGRQVRVIPEQVDPDRPGHWQGRCDQYALISIPGPLERERIIRAIPSSINDDVILAQEIPATVPLPVL